MCLRCVAAFFLIFRSPIAVAWILTVGGLITLTAISVPSLRATRIAATDLVVTFDDPPVWLDSSLLTELQNIVRSHLAAIPVGRNGLINASSALEGTGWFTNVEQVAWVDASHAKVTATFLIPHARVRTTKGQRFIDPMELFSQAETEELFHQDITLSHSIHPSINRHNDLAYAGMAVTSSRDCKCYDSFTTSPGLYKLR